MALQIGSNEVSVGLKVKDEGSDSVKKFGDNTEKSMDKSSKATKKASTNWKAVGAAVAAAAAAVVAGMVKMITSVADLADAAIKTADKLGLTVETLTSLRFAAGLAGIESEALNASLQLLSRNTVDAADGTGLAVDAYKQLGLSAKAILALPIEQQIAAIADAMEKIPNQQRRVALAMDLFGRSGASMLLLMKGGSKAFLKQTKLAKELGGVIGTKLARDAEVFNDNIAKMKFLLSGVTNQITSEMLPTLNALTESWIQAGKEGQGMSDIARGIGFIFKILASAAQIVLNIFRQIASVIAVQFAAIAAAMEGEFKRAFRVLADLPSEMKRIHQQGADDINAIWKEVKAEPDEKKTKDAAITRNAANKLETQKLTEELAKRLEAVQDSNLTELEILQLQKEAEQEVLTQALANRLISVEEFERQLTLTQMRFQKLRADNEKVQILSIENFSNLSARSKTAVIIKEIVAATAAAAATNKTMFRINKIANIANAIMDTHAAVARMLKLPFPLNVAMAAVVAAAGFYRVRQIKAQKFGDGAAGVGPQIAAPSVSPEVGTGGGFAPPASTQNNQQQQQREQISNLVLVGNRRTQLTFEEMDDVVMPFINEQIKNGATRFNTDIVERAA